jgi:NAD(P)H-quinone oxidoreductase subunit 4
MINRVFFGRLPDRFDHLSPVKWFETFPAFVIAGLLIVYGIQPSLFLDWSKAQIATIVPGIALQSDVLDSTLLHDAVNVTPLSSGN